MSVQPKYLIHLLLTNILLAHFPIYSSFYYKFPLI